MPVASYQVRPLIWPLWRWEAEYEGVAKAHGLALTREAAQAAARRWLLRQGVERDE